MKQAILARKEGITYKAARHRLPCRLLYDPEV